ncbi:SurA N-terminal domain-containing protein [Flavobacteriales bacterium]|nr:SurA N-terminal domain-containing protein [Flavobacteriales bacterium]MDB2621684.1 SurA N-terminal domain-containing protein [Flavobacteriales bacterium]
MISLDKLRKRSGLLIVGIGIAMGAFLLGDLMSSGTSLFNGTQGVLGEVNDQVIDYREFETEAQNIDRIFSGSQDRNGLRDNLWADKVNEVVMGEQYSDLGISISSEELAQITFGYNSGEMSTTARQFFGVTGQDIKPAELAAVIQQIQDNDPQRWLYLENVIRKERLGQKYSSMVRQGLNASNLDADSYFAEQGNQVSGSYLFKRFDTSIEVTEAEVTSYYKANKEDYPQDASRELTVAVFEIEATQADKDALKSKLEDLLEDKEVYNKAAQANETVEGFRSTSDAASFVDRYSDSSFDPTFYAVGQLPPSIEGILRNADLGFVYGPYEEEGSYKVARLNARRSDSIQVAIVEFSIDASEETANEIYAQASELAAAKNGEELEVLAEEKNRALTTAVVQDQDRSVSGVGDDARNLVFWAYNERTELNAVKLEDQNNRIVVAMLTDISEEGTQDLEEVRFQIEMALKREKSGEALAEAFNKELASASTIEELAAAMDLAPQQVSDVNFNTNAIPSGFEPNVVGAFCGVEKGQLSNPIIGNNGVYVVSTEDAKELDEATKNYTSLKQQLDVQIKSRANFEVYNALKELADIEDNRAKFY